jgi:predicted RNase H-like HicB family nuclease
VIRVSILVATGNVMRPFIAFIRKQPEMGFRVSFPDLPDCNSTGSTIAEARQNAENALTLHCQRLQRFGVPIPRPSYMHQIVLTQERVLDGLVALIAPPGWA